MGNNLAEALSEGWRWLQAVLKVLTVDEQRLKGSDREMTWPSQTAQSNRTIARAEETTDNMQRATECEIPTSQSAMNRAGETTDNIQRATENEIPISQSAINRAGETIDNIQTAIQTYIQEQERPTSNVGMSLIQISLKLLREGPRFSLTNNF